MTEICETLDGLPLGIELAAARMAAMSAVEVRDRLADRFRLLQGSTPGPGTPAHARHAVEWSYDLLTDDERRAAPPDARSSPAASTWRASCAVADDADEVDVLRHLDSLVRKSLVVADHTATRTRYSLFETIRQFAEDRLAEAGDARSARATGTPRTSPARRPTAGSTGTGPAGATRSTGWRSELGNLRAGYQWSAGARRRSRWRPTSPRTPR